MNSPWIADNDQKLLDASKNGDEKAFGLLFNKYWDDLFRIAYRRLHAAEDAKDIVQDVFLSLWNNIGSITIEDSLGGYLYTALRNKIFNHFEKNNNRLQKLMQRQFVPAEHEETVFSNYCTKELQQFITQQVATMPEKMRQIYLLSREEHLTHAEISTLLSLSNQTVKNQLYNAVSRLRKAVLKEHFPAIVICYEVLSAVTHQPSVINTY
ncbi:MAG: RNA polymerase sigma-70 factor [Chitinophagaceae bacterium]|nr:RNA polymerase sigma-70 factor [Chitinophagaceae bacterium]